MAASVMPFAGDVEHLGAELVRLDLLLAHQAARARRAAGGDPDQRGLYVDDEELAALLQRPLAEPLWDATAGDAELERALREHEALLSLRVAATLKIGRSLRLVELATKFALEPLERDAVLLTLAPALDLRYERIVGWLHDDVTRRRVSVQLVLDLFAPGLAARLPALARLQHGPLSRFGLVELHAPEPGAPLLRHELRLAPGVVAWLMGQDARDPALARLCERVRPAADARAALLWPPALAEAYERLSRGPGAGVAVNLVGPDGAGRRAFAAAVSGGLARPLELVDGTGAAELDDAGFVALVQALGRAARLDGAAICVGAVDRLAEVQAGRRARALLRELGGATPLFLCSTRAWQPTPAVEGAPPLAELHVSAPDRATRVALWQREAADAPAGAHALVADSFRFTPGQVRAAAATARGLAWSRGAAGVDASDLMSACRRHATPRLGSLAAAVASGHAWSDLVLPAEQTTQLKLIVQRLRLRPVVLDAWGFGRHGGVGVTALFAGPPGTGKTMAAALVARETGRDLYRIDLSQVVSKYIGETEKLLEQVFAEAESTDVALLFDEADALFGKRGAVKDAHDRYANIEVGYLLQRIEGFSGLVILATNLRKNMDAAFVRRLHLIVDFPQPDVAGRARIWRQIWPPEAPLDGSIDPQLLAERFDLSGGHIRNIAVTAAYAAAEEGAPIGLRHVFEAARGEYRKIEKLIPEQSFALP